MTNLTVEYVGDSAEVTGHPDYPHTTFHVKPDEGVENPLVADRFSYVEHYVVSAGYHSASDKPEGYISKAYSHFDNNCWMSKDKDYAIKTTRRFMRIFHGWTEERAENNIGVFNTIGYSQSDWAELFVAVTEEGYGNAEGYAKEWEMWARGDVYYIYAEDNYECDVEGCHLPEEDHVDENKELGILHGIYADSPEEAVGYYLESY